MNPAILLFLVQLLLFITAYPQDKRFIGRVILLDGNPKKVHHLSVRLVNLGTGVTGTDGKFEVAIPNNTSEVTLELAGTDLAILYPTGGRALVPADENKPVEFIVGDSPKSILTKAVAKSNNELKDRLGELGVQQDAIEKTLSLFREDIQRMTDIKLSELKDQIDLDSKRSEFYPELASAINDFLNEAKDIKDAFKFTSRHAFDDPQALQVLRDAISSYNNVFEKLNRQHSGYEKTVNDLWQSEAKAAEVRELFNYALGELHSANIFTLNLKIQDINDYNRGQYRGSKRTFRDTILRDIESNQLQLERRLEELNNRARVLLTKLSA